MRTTFAVCICIAGLGPLALQALGCASDPSASGTRGSGGDGGDGGDGPSSNGVTSGPSATGTGASSSGSGASGSGVGGSGAGGSGVGGSGAGGSGAGGMALDLPVCLHTCSAASDCALGGPTTDADNYACSAGKCEWLGCKSTAECVALSMNPSWACGVIADISSVPSCYHTCGAAADCEMGSPLYGADNYACSSGLCKWLGCTTSDECAQAYNSPDYVCGLVNGSTYKTCYKNCVSAGDCALAGAPLFGADNYACNSGKCEWQGCNTSTECADTYMNPSYVCD